MESNHSRPAVRLPIGYGPCTPKLLASKIRLNLEHQPVGVALHGRVKFRKNLRSRIGHLSFVLSHPPLSMLASATPFADP